MNNMTFFLPCLSCVDPQNVSRSHAMKVLAWRHPEAPPTDRTPTIQYHHTRTRVLCPFGKISQHSCVADSSVGGRSLISLCISRCVHWWKVMLNLHIEHDNTPQSGIPWSGHISSTHTLLRVFLIAILTFCDGDNHQWVSEHTCCLWWWLYATDTRICPRQISQRGNKSREAWCRKSLRKCGVTDVRQHRHTRNVFRENMTGHVRAV